MRPPEPLPTADYIVTESTYGNRTHAPTDPLDELAEVANRTLSRGGALLIPVFAVGRAQTVLHLLSELRRANRIPEVPVYLNSPMAVNATELFCTYLEEHKLTAEQCRQMCAGVRFVRTAEESMKVTPLGGPMIALSASGMASGGRVLHHLERLAPDHRNTVLFVGYQAAGTRGQAMLAGADRVKIFGSYVPVRAEVASIDGLSAHAGSDELTTWLGHATTPPKAVYIVHGEPAAADALRRTLRDDLGWNTQVPDHGETVELGPSRDPRRDRSATDAQAANR